MEEFYRTGDTVPETSMYVCKKNGQEKSFREGETFDLCPESWENTSWEKKPKIL
jgi:hypothetical protein